MPDAGRVIAGAARGIRLLAPGQGTRPLGDRVKQALFGMLGSAAPAPWTGPFLDLFAGSGAAGIEALSRGAPRALFVERDPGAVAVIATNLQRTRLAGGEVSQREAVALLAEGRTSLAGDWPPFAAAFVDPPYADRHALATALARLGDATLGWLRDDAVVAAKRFWRDSTPDRVGDLAAVRRRRFGETAIDLYRREPVPGPGRDPSADREPVS
jgi:16S rRNA (guanine966-N2)-methyltransferase